LILNVNNNSYAFGKLFLPDACRSTVAAPIKARKICPFERKIFFFRFAKSRQEARTGWLPHNARGRGIGITGQFPPFSGLRLADSRAPQRTQTEARPRGRKEALFRK
jgi:hypothetical protein